MKRIAADWIDEENRQEVWRIGFWTGALTSFVVIVGILLISAMVVTANAQPSTEGGFARSIMDEAQAENDADGVTQESVTWHCPRTAETRPCGLRQACSFGVVRCWNALDMPKWARLEE